MTKRSRKLSLTRETVRSLDSRLLGHVIGGTDRSDYGTRGLPPKSGLPPKPPAPKPSGGDYPYK